MSWFYERQRPTPRRTQRPRPVIYKGEVKEDWEEIGVSSYTGQGMLPQGNNLYAALLNDMRSQAVTIQMLGWLDEGGDFSDESGTLFESEDLDYATGRFVDHIGDIPWEDKPIWFSRKMRRDELLDYMQAFARGNEPRELFLQELGRATDYRIADVKTIRLIPRDFAPDLYGGDFA